MRPEHYAPWEDQQKLSRLIELREQGKPFSKIAEELGISKNSAVGKFRRVAALREKQGNPIIVPIEALSNHNGSWKPGPGNRIAKKKSAVVRTVNEPFADIAIPESKRVTLADVRAGECRWVIGDVNGPETVFCGNPVESRSFCAGHLAIGFYKPEKSRRSFKLQDLSAK